MSGYISNVPLSNQTLAQTQPTINNNFTQLNNIYGVDHVDYTNAQSPGGLGGQHLKSSYLRQAVDPAALANTNIVYDKTVTYTGDVTPHDELFMERSTGDGSTVIQLTCIKGNPSATTNGTSFLPGGIIIQWGRNTINAGNNTVAVTFPVAFPNSVFSINVTPSSSGSGLSNNIPGANGLTNTSFNLNRNSTSGGTILFLWIAIGN